MWIVFIFFACVEDGCTLTETQAMRISPDVEKAIVMQCANSPICMNPRPGFFMIRRDVPKSPAAIITVKH